MYFYFFFNGRLTLCADYPTVSFLRTHSWWRGATVQCQPTKCFAFRRCGDPPNKISKSVLKIQAFYASFWNFASLWTVTNYPFMEDILRDMAEFLPYAITQHLFIFFFAIFSLNPLNPLHTQNRVRTGFNIPRLCATHIPLLITFPSHACS